MTNLKKTLAVVLAFAMILSMGFSAFAYTDVAEGTKVSEAVGILSNLGILTGFEDGTFKPDETVTRAQMAAIICRTLGYEDQAKSSAGSTIFNDVAADHWAAGYINVAQSLQIINGYGDGNYGPEDQVTYEQAVKMIVVALGYELDAQAKGGWSTGYLAVASREGITKNANGTVGAPAVRGTIAVLVYNSLEVRLMDQNSWSTSGQDDAFGKTDETILSQYLEVEKVEGVVETVPFVDYADGYTVDMDAMITFAPGAKAFYYADGKLMDDGDVEASYDVSLVPEANEMAGKKVVAYVGMDEDETTGNHMVYAIAEKQGANKVTVISAAQLVETTDKDGTKPGVIAYRNVGSTRINTLDLDEVIRASINYGSGDFDKELTKDSTTEDLANEAENGIITLISNDANSKIDVIQITKYESEAVVEAVSTEDGVISFDLYAGDLEDIDTEDEDMLYVVIKDGAVATVADIAANDTVSIVNVNKTFQVLYVSSKTVTGAVEYYDDDVVTIAGADYEISPLSNEISVPSDLSGKEGIFFLNVDGQIAHDEAEASKGNYAVVIAAGTTTGLGGGYEIEVVLADGTSATYTLNDKAYIEGVNDGKDSNPAKGSDTTYTALQKNLTENKANGTFEAKYGQVENNVFELTVKNGKVTKLVPLASANKEAVTDKEFDAENMSYGSISFNESTVIISVEATSGEVVKADDVKVGKVADFMVDGEGEKCSLLSYDLDNNDIAGLVVGYELSTTVPKDGAAVIITSVKSKEIDSDTAYVITGMQAGKEVTYTIYDEDASIDDTYLKKGNVILVGIANAEGMVSDFVVLYDAEKGIQITYDANDDEKNECDEDEYYFAGALDELQAPTSSKFYLDDQVVVGDASYDDEEGIVMRNSANYTLVDYSESSTNPEVSKKSKGTGLFSRYSSSYDYKIFVRYYDDNQVEVVVYKYNQADEA